MDRKIDEVTERLFELYGGPEALVSDFENRLREFDTQWNQNAELMGRILRAHLVVEYYLTKWLQYKNPNLGSIDDARASFSLKVNLIGNCDALVKECVPSLKQLNKVRNRVAHNLSVEILPEDEKIFRSTPFFKDFNNHEEYYYCRPDSLPIEVLEGFAKFIGGYLQAHSSDRTEIWNEAFKNNSKYT